MRNFSYSINFTDQPLFLFLFTRKGNSFLQRNEAENILTEISNLRVLHTAGSNLAVADMLGVVISTTQSKNASHQLFANYGFDQFTLQILDKGNTVICTPLDFFIPICFILFLQMKNCLKTKLKPFFKKLRS